MKIHTLLVDQLSSLFFVHVSATICLHRLILSQQWAFTAIFLTRTSRQTQHLDFQLTCGPALNGEWLNHIFFLPKHSLTKDEWWKNYMKYAGMFNVVSLVEVCLILCLKHLKENKMRVSFLFYKSLLFPTANLLSGFLPTKSLISLALDKDQNCMPR